LRSLISKIPVGKVWAAKSIETGQFHHYMKVHDIYNNVLVVNLTLARVSEFLDVEVEYEIVEVWEGRGII
jgi:hypothetical protein